MGHNAGTKFVASYSGGKDCVLAIYKAVKRGMNPLALITTYNTEQGRSWFHGVPEAALEAVADSVGIPIWLIKTDGENYARNFESTLRNAKKAGAQACVFGDIDIGEHIQWCADRCVNAGLEPVFPLYGHSRESIVGELLDCGFTAHITIIDSGKLRDDLLGKTLTMETLKIIRSQGADICGENGEYHTFVSNGPLFRMPVHFRFSEKIVINNRSILPIVI